MKEFKLVKTPRSYLLNGRKDRVHKNESVPESIIIVVKFRFKFGSPRSTLNQMRDGENSLIGVIRPLCIV